MKPGVKLAAFALVLAAAFGGGAGLGAIFAPDSPAPKRTDNIDNTSNVDMPGMDMTPQSPAPPPGH